SLAGGSIRSSPICRAFTTASASRSCRPPAGSCRTAKPASPRSAAKCCAAYSEPRTSEEQAMSRIGKNPVAIPAGVTVDLAGQVLTAKGSLGSLSLTVHGDVEAKVADGQVSVTPRTETKRARALWGTTRALVNNMVTGVSTGFTRNLEINGV